AKTVIVKDIATVPSWQTDFDNDNTGFNVLKDEEYDDQDYQREYDVSN
ncbi:45932_t:CDS:2, partial [Gigaspora margarita]